MTAFPGRRQCQESLGEPGPVGSEGPALRTPHRKGSALRSPDRAGVRALSAFVRGVRAGEEALAAVGVSGDATWAGLGVPYTPAEAGKGMGTNGGPGRGQTQPALY